MNWKARVFCPQCGGELEIEAGDPVLKCGYCRTRLHVAAPNPLSYTLPGSEDLIRNLSHEKVIHIPFWRFRGLHFKAFRSRKIRTSILDTTVMAVSEPDPYASLGLRPQVSPLTMIFDKDLARPGQDLQSALFLAQMRTAELEDEKVLFQRFIGESSHLVYAPYMLPLTATTGMGADVLLRPLFQGGTPIKFEVVKRYLNKWATQRSFCTKPVFLPLICPQCANELPSKAWSVAYLCHACWNNWLVQGIQMLRIPYKVLQSTSNPCKYLPFWELKVRVQEMRLHTMKDLLNSVISYRKAPSAWERCVPRFLIPAFKINPRMFLKLSSTLSLSPELLLDEAQGAALFQDLKTNAEDIEAIRLHVTEAAQAIKMILGYMLRNRRDRLLQVSKARIKVMGARLWYLPYVSQGLDFVQVQSGIAVSKQALFLGRGI